MKNGEIRDVMVTENELYHNPVGRTVTWYDRTDQPLASHTIVFGNQNGGREDLLLRQAEVELAAGRQILYVTDNVRAHGLATDYKVVRLGRGGVDIIDSNGSISDEHIQLIAGLIVARKNVILNVDGFEHQDVSRMLERLIGTATTTKDMMITIFCETCDFMVRRKRHRDSTTTTHIKSALSKGRPSLASPGVIFAFASISPAEIPIEINNFMMDVILTRSSNPNNVRAIASTLNEPDLVDRHKTAPTGCSYMNPEIACIWPHSRPTPNMPFMMKVTPPQSGARLDRPDDRPFTRDENAFQNDLKSATGRGEGRKSRKGRRRNQSDISTASHKRSVARFSPADGDSSSNTMLKDMGFAHYTLLSTVAKMVISSIKSGSVDYSVRVSNADLASAVRTDPTINQSTVRSQVLYAKSDRTVPPSTLAYVHNRIGSSADLNTFLDDLTAIEPKSDAARGVKPALTKMAGDFSAETNLRRIATIESAWLLHSSSAGTANTAKPRARKAA